MPRLSLEDLIGGKSVRCTHWSVRTRRRLDAICYAGDLNLNEAIAREGWATADSRSPAYVPAAKDAKRANRGIWRGKFIEPSDWRDRGERLGCEKKRKN